MKDQLTKYEHRILKVEPGSIAEELEIEPGDVLLAIDGHEVEDIFDYQYMTNEEFLQVLIRKQSGEEWELEIEKEFEEDLGIEFENPLLDHYRSCSNKCVFCFIDQMPPGMRETLYFKDDDSRLSFLQGNYVTLTNMSDHDIDRILYYHLEPINISFHTLNPELRCHMLHNRFAGDSLAKAKRLADAGIAINGQIVLCRGINDGSELEYSLSRLEEYMPALKSLSVVPVGLTKFRDGLTQLEPFDQESARTVLDQIHRWQRYYKERYGTNLVHPGDEWYLLADEPIPGAEAYEGYQQLENGVGMLRLLMDEAREAVGELEASRVPGEISIATGVLAAPFIRSIADMVKEKRPNLKVHVYTIINDYFGERITVAGLLTGSDLQRQLSGKQLGSQLLLSRHMLRSGEEILLDDVTVPQLEESLQIGITIVESSGYSLVDAMLQPADC